MTSTVRRSTDKGLSRLKKAMDSNQNPLSPAEMDFVHKSCHILGIDSAEMIDVIGRKALEKGSGQVRKVTAAITAQLDELGKRVEIHRRAMPTPAFSRHTYDDMDAPARSPAHLQVCAKGLRDAMVGRILQGDQSGQDSAGKCSGRLQGHHSKDRRGSQVETWCG
jgi:hypothetical protein